MSSCLEYHIFVTLFRNAAISLFLFPLFFVSSICAQVTGAPPTSTVIPPLVGRSVNPPTGTPVGSRGLPPGPGTIVPVSRPPIFQSNASRTADRHPHHHHDREFAPPFFYAVPVPYAVDSGPADDSASSEEEDEYQGGPTIFDRRGSGFDSYVPPVRDVPTPHAASNASAPAAPDPPQAPTVLVFKSGRKLEVGNYAIVGATLFDLTPGHTRKIALADLDLAITRQQNDDRGVTFQLPPPQEN